ncbi:hypothetical protein EMIT0P265_300006 [Pseudomonas zeae]
MEFQQRFSTQHRTVGCEFRSPLNKKVASALSSWAVGADWK